MCPSSIIRLGLQHTNPGSNNLHARASPLKHPSIQTSIEPEPANETKQTHLTIAPHIQNALLTHGAAISAGDHEIALASSPLIDLRSSCLSTISLCFYFYFSRIGQLKPLRLLQYLFCVDRPDTELLHCILPCLSSLA